VAWYLGPVMVIAAWLLLAGLASRATRWWLRSAGSSVGSSVGSGAEPNARLEVPPWLAPAAVGLASTVLTLYRPGITPDHPWADRRLVPLVLPTVVIAAGAAVAWVGRFARRRWPASLLFGVLATAAASMLLPPWLATAPVASKGTEQGEANAVRQVCDRLRPGDAVVAVDGRASDEWVQVIRGVCGRPSAAVKVLDPNDDPMAAIRRAAVRIVAAGRHPVLLAAEPIGAELQRDLGLSPVQVVNLHTTEDQRYLTRVPDGSVALDVQVWLARWPAH
jgi:hypothetical protein